MRGKTLESSFERNVDGVFGSGMPVTADFRSPVSSVGRAFGFYGSPLRPKCRGYKEVLLEASQGPARRARPCPPAEGRHWGDMEARSMWLDPDDSNMVSERNVHLAQSLSKEHLLLSVTGAATTGWKHCSGN
ncbi:hypothetical protein O181_026610 [Austropuccinia psidii MF-1]|uniref:Uncharacterized protein n=1 Tax=Austropuccinia psidii MF-1 TaxID=1389203 RepID=A0A9Q3H2C5_9BASI|nr:hypothetical protein [Austropuccinia psidii MF-1]